MKVLLLLVGLLVFLPMSSQAAPADVNSPSAIKYMFCAAETQHEGIICSEIRKIRFGIFNLIKCQRFAADNNAQHLMAFQNSKKKILKEKQLEVCDMLPGKSKWACFKIEDCGMSSSISPLGGIEAFAPFGNVEQARDNCVMNGWVQYRQALIDVNHGCKIAPDAVEMMF